FMYCAIAITLVTGAEYFVKALSSPKATEEISSR
ncbi:MAG: hypothetical protein RL435_229, partial [Actinomycetota bacterium]